MSKYDDQLSRMQYLMDFDNRLHENKGSNKIEYHTEGADGKVYGIIKEGTKYYIMTTEKGKENLAESYDYIGGFRYRGENAYTSYNKASKQLEEKMIALNESYGIHEDVSMVDFDRTKKVMATLTEEARKELDRVQAIMENTTNIGIKKSINYDGVAGDPAKKGEPFEEKAEAKLDKDMPESHKTPETANKDMTTKKDAEKNLTSDKEPAAPSGEAKDDTEKAKVDIEGNSVATQDPKGGKAVVVKEEFNPVVGDEELPLDGGEDIAPEQFDNAAGIEEPIQGTEDVVIDDVPAEDGVPSAEGEIVGIDGDEDLEDIDLDTLMEQFNDIITGNDKTLTGCDGGGESEAIETIEEKAEVEGGKEGKEEALKGPNGNGESISTDTLNESMINQIVKRTVKAVKPQIVRESLEDRIVNAVKKELGIWGKHPRYRQQPMTLPADKEVDPNGDNRSWDDDSVKGNTVYGNGPGDGAPFDEAIELLTDDVMNRLQESVKKKI